MKTALKFCFLFFIFGLLFPGRAQSATRLPPGFSESWVAGGFLKPTTMAFAPDGRLFVCEQEGKLRVVKNGQLLSAPFASVEVNFQAERGLIGVAIDPNYSTNGYVYIYYTAKTPTVHNRISRVQANPNNRDVALKRNDGSLLEEVLFDLDDLSEAAIHNGGAMHFGIDGKLYVAVGENATPSNAQSLNTVKGKMLRLNPDGSIPVDNPFYNQTTGNNRAIYALGFRNPFNFDIQPGTGRIFANDVGASAWEEINEVLPGANYGWPTVEGPSTDSRFVAPLFAYPHGADETSGCAITGGTFYNPANHTFPDEYSGKYFFTDYCNSWIRVLDPATKTATTFTTGLPLYPVDLKVGPDGSLYYISHAMGAIYRISYAPRTAPGITSHPQSITVSQGQSATFQVRATGSPTLRYQWQRNGSNISGATSSSYATTGSSTNNGSQFRCVVSNDFGSATSNSATLTVTTGGGGPTDPANAFPVGSIIAPANNSLYIAGDTIHYEGMGTDPEDGTLPPGAFTWQVDFHHDEHTHPFVAATSGALSGSFKIPTIGETSTNVWYRIYLTVTDSKGARHTTFVDIRPRTVQITLQTAPAGLQLKLDGQPQVAPYTFSSVVGVQREIEAFAHTANGTTYEFVTWSDNGAAKHDITTPANNTTYTATYRTTTGDTVAPLISVSAPVHTWSYRTLSSASGTASDSGGSGLKDVSGRLMRYVDNAFWNGTAWTASAVETPASGTANWTWTMPASLPDGRYAFRATARDNVSNTTSSTVTDFYVDTLAPQITVTAPQPNATYASLLQATGSAIDAGPGVAEVRGRLMRFSDGQYWNGSNWVGGAVETAASGTQSWTWNMPALPDGRYAFRAWARDYVGNASTSQLIEFVIATPPPITAAAVRVGAPRFVKDTVSGTTYLQVPLYVRGGSGTGSGTVAGTWKLTRSDGQTFDVPINSTVVDLSSGEWRELPGAGALFSVPRDELVGNWTLQATLDGGASTHIISAAVTDFTPEEHGWQFPNTFSKIGGVFAGLGLGMSLEAVRFYKSDVALPDVPLPPTKKSNLYKQLQKAQKTAESDFKKVDLRRLVQFGSGAVADEIAVASETDNIGLHLQKGSPCVVILVPKRSVSQKVGSSHAVVATASFFSDDFYSEGDAPQNTPHKVRLFAVYDSNYPNVYQYAFAVDNGNGFTWNFDYLPRSSPFYDLLRFPLQHQGGS